MKYGLSLPTGGECGDPRFLVELAERAEAAGWDGVFPEDYVLYQGDPTMPTSPTWPVLAAIAVRTKRLVLGVEATPLARRRPWNVAREVAAVDQLSEGRVHGRSGARARRSATASGGSGPIAAGGSARRDDWDAEREHIATVRDAGADWWVEWVKPAERDEMRRVVDGGPLRDAAA